MTETNGKPWTFPEHVHGWLTLAEGQKLAELASGKRVLEIGSYEGKSTICMAQTAGMVICIDPFDGRATSLPQDTLFAFRTNLRLFGVEDRVHPLVGTSREMMRQVPPVLFDLALIDGDHAAAEVRHDIEQALARLAPDGLIACHDYRRFPGEVDGRWDMGVTQTVNEFLRDGRLVAVDRVDSLIILRPVTTPKPSPPPSEPGKPLVALAMPTYGSKACFQAVQAYDLFPTSGGCNIVRLNAQSSFLTKNFNRLLAAALDLRCMDVTHFAMIHDDLAPVGHGWLDLLLAEMRNVGAVMISAAAAIKSDEGLTSVAVADDLGDPWHCRRLTLKELHDLPETFSAADVGGPLLLNTGLWVIDLQADFWHLFDEDGCQTVCFDVKNRITKDPRTGERRAEAIPEDWLFSQTLNRLGIPIAATRKVVTVHHGEQTYSTETVWGKWETDQIYRNVKEVLCAAR